MRKYYYIILFATFILRHPLYGQISLSDECEIYGKIAKDVKLYKDSLGNKKIYFINELEEMKNLVPYINSINSMVKDDLKKYNININKFDSSNASNEIPRSVKCALKNICKKKYYAKFEKDSWNLNKVICYFSHIAYYDNYAFIFIKVNYSRGAAFTNIYFLQKKQNWQILISKKYYD
jgi:hypothetical protein